jgi:iron complex transport system permease protein
MRSVTPARVALVSAGLVAVLVAVLVACVLLGSAPLDLSRALDRSIEPNTAREILFGRLRRALFGAVAGGTLAVVGAAFQALLRNPLADPFILGVSGGAALGGTIAIAAGLPAVAGLAMASVPLLSFLGGLLALVLVYALSVRNRRARPHDVLLVGVVFNAFASAVITFLKTVVSAQTAQEILFWLVGTLSSVDWIGRTQLYLAGGLALAGALVLLADARRLNLLTFGDEDARTLGVDAESVRRRVFFACSLVVGAVASVTGLIGFVGLVVPHAVRLVVGPDHRILLPATLLVGAAFLPLADLGARLAFPIFATGMPVGVVTAVIGAPTFVWLLRRGRRLGAGDAVLG